MDGSQAQWWKPSKAVFFFEIGISDCRYIICLGRWREEVCGRRYKLSCRINSNPLIQNRAHARHSDGYCTLLKLLLCRFSLERKFWPNPWTRATGQRRNQSMQPLKFARGNYGVEWDGSGELKCVVFLTNVLLDTLTLILHTSFRVLNAAYDWKYEVVSCLTELNFNVVSYHLLVGGMSPYLA